MNESSGLQVKQLHKTYANGVHALNNVDLHIGAGLYGLLGPNGAGKSTLMRTLATLQTPDSGSILFDGVDVLANPNHLRQQLGYLPQQIGAYPNVSGYRLLERFAWLKGRTHGKERRREVEQLLEQVNLNHAAHRAVTEYSGGMLRRFGIALALLGAPRFLIVDEPTAGLDPAERNRFHRVLADVATDAVVLLSTHIVEDVENLCQRLSILAGGQIVAEGMPSELVAPLHNRLWSCVLAKGEALPVQPLRVTAAPSGLQVVVESTTPPDSRYQPVPPTLEDVYYKMLGVDDALELAA